MSDTNERRVAHKTLGKLLALGAMAGVYSFATVGAAGLMMAATDMSAQAAGHCGHGGGGGHEEAVVVVTLPGVATVAVTSGMAVGGSQAKAVAGAARSGFATKARRGG